MAEDRDLSEEERALIEAHLDRHPPPRKSADRRKRRALPISSARFSTMVRRGKVPVDRTIDLHGLTLDEAKATLTQTLTAATAQRYRCLRIITGKGLGSGTGKGVLASEIPEWLRNRPEVSEVVQAVKARDGGSGAWFVRIRLP